MKFSATASLFFMCTSRTTLASPLLTACPDIGATPAILDEGSQSLQITPQGKLCTLVKLALDDDGNAAGPPIPVARSYNGHSWENAAGVYATAILDDNMWDCSAESCNVVLPPVESSSVFALTSFARETSATDDDARFLESVTFGTTKADLELLSSLSPAEWVSQQIDIDASSHREYFRRRTNARWAFPQRGNLPDHPCAPASRWRNFAIARTDASTPVSRFFDQTVVSFEAVGVNGAYVLLVDGFPRTILTEAPAFSDSTRALDVDEQYEICQLGSEFTGATVKLLAADGSCQSVAFKNPLVDFTGYEDVPTRVLPFLNSSSMLEPIDAHLHLAGRKEGHFILSKDLDESLLPDECDAVNQLIDLKNEPVFALLGDGTWLIHDPRIVLEDNTLDNPLFDGGGFNSLISDGVAICANAPRTFLNADKCVLSSAPYACGSTGASDGVGITMDDDSITALSSMSGRYMYAILGLPVVDAFDSHISNPCTDNWRSRWEIQSGQSCAGMISLGATTLATLSSLLSSSTDPNPYMRDIIFPAGGECDAADQSSPVMEIQVGGDCYLHQHPDWNSVFDLTSWVSRHPGGANAISKWLDEDNLAYLTFPAFGSAPHALNRWESNREHFAFVARMGDNLNFRDIPDGLKGLASVAEYFGASAGDDNRFGSVMVCGSEGEVENDPYLGQAFVPNTEQKGRFYPSLQVPRSPPEMLCVLKQILLNSSPVCVYIYIYMHTCTFMYACVCYAYVCVCVFPYYAYCVTLTRPPTPLPHDAASERNHMDNGEPHCPGPAPPTHCMGAVPGAGSCEGSNRQQCAEGQRAISSLLRHFCPPRFWKLPRRLEGSIFPSSHGGTPLVPRLEILRIHLGDAAEALVCRRKFCPRNHAAVHRRD
jgi:hypothetical protein